MRIVKKIFQQQYRYFTQVYDRLLAIQYELIEEIIIDFKYLYSIVRVQILP